MDQLFSLVLDNPYVPWIAAAAVLYFLYSRFLSGAKIRGVSGPNLSLDSIMGSLLGSSYASAKIDRAVQREKKLGNFLAAGRLYEDAERPQEAVDAYVQGKEFFAAAAVLERLGKLDRAAELYLQQGDYKKAAQVFTEAGKPARAAALFLEKGNTLEAARLFGAAQEWAKAADLYVKAGYPLRAAEAYEKKGEFLRAAECHEKHFMENVSFATTYSATAASADHKSALLAGRLYEKGGELNRAYQIYSKGSYFKEAAQTLMGLGQPAKAAELFMRAEDPESAAQAFDQAGDRVKAANLRGEVAAKQDRIPEAARFFQEGQDYLRAAELFESVGMLAEAAGAYEAGESHVAAAGVYVRAGLKERAAASYERGGEFETAAKFYEEAGKGKKAIELYDRAGLTYKSGEAAANSGERDRAIALLQRVPASDENYRPATELLAKLFIEARMPGLAIERLQKVLGSDPVSPSNLDLCYWLAAGYEASGNGREALQLYKKILSEDLHYRDVERRVARLEAAAVSRAVAPAVVGGPSPPPAPAAAGAVAAAPPPQAAPAPPSAAAAPAPPPSRVPAAAPAPAPAAKGPRFARKEEVGRGPLGTVFRAEDTTDGRSVALRVLPPQLLRAEGVAASLLQDLKAASQISHPNIAKVLGIVDSGGERCVLSEFVPGKPFSEALKKGHRTSYQQAHSLFRLLAQSLAFLHGKGLVHGSVQPSNVLVASGVVKITDLGLGRLAYAFSPTDNYRAPENRLDVAGDIYAMAAVIYHLLTGVHPRTQPQGPAMPLPSKYAAGVGEAFDKLIARCLHPRPELRYETAERVLAELKDMVRIG